METQIRLINNRNTLPVINRADEQEINSQQTTPTSPAVNEPERKRSARFIEANTETVSLSHLKNECIIPVFRDNEKTISHFEFIDAVNFCVNRVYSNTRINAPEIRVSHKINGRIPSALNKKVSELEEWEKTLYYERMAFFIEVPGITETINGNRVNLTVAGVRGLNHESLFSRKSVERFKVVVGFNNLVCTNFMVNTDGAMLDIRITSLQELVKKVLELLTNYNMKLHLATMSDFGKYRLTEHQFAQMIGKARLYQFLPPAMKKEIPALNFTDSQFNTIARDYYLDKSFCKDTNGEINLWKVYNLFTGSNKSSYIDTFLDRSLNAFTFTENLLQAMESQGGKSWFLS